MSEKYTIERIGEIIVVHFAKNPGVGDFVAAYLEVSKMESNHLRIWDLIWETLLVS